MLKPIRSGKLLALFTGISILTLPAAAQNMNNPYSIYGVGDIDNRIYNRTSGMAGTGLAIQSSAYLVDNNPAGIAGLPQSFFTAHLAFTGKASTFSGTPINSTNSNSNDMWIKRFALAIKVNKFWAASIGMGQFSNVNYQFSGTRSVEGSSAVYDAYYEGDGGLNDYYFTNAFRIGKHFSIGVKSSLIAGSINQVETLLDNDQQSSVIDSIQDYMANLRFQGGFIFQTPLNKNWDFSLGGKYSPETRFTSERTLSVTGNGVSIIQDKYLNSKRFYLPQTIGAGIALKRKKKTTYAIDYTYEGWTPLGIKGSGWQLINSSRITAGAEFAKISTRSGVSVERRFFQLGGYYSSSYLQVRNTPVNEYGFTAGMGGLLSNSLLYSVSLEAGVRGTVKNGLIRETFYGITFNISYRDFLFTKGRLYD